MRQKTTSSQIENMGLWGSMLMVAIFPMILGLALAEAFPDWRWSHYPFHAMVESVGALSALIIAALMVVLLNKGHLARRYIMVACALIGMGLLDGFHAVLHVGISFVWLHSAATLVGGILFASIWLPEAWLTEGRQRLLLLATIIFSLSVGLVSILHPEILPIMVVDGEFSILAKVFNVTGGFGFLIGSLYFIRDYWLVINNPVAKKECIEDIVFTNHCLLFGIAGLLFETSSLWDTGWWWWHILRFLAYSVVLVYFFVLFKRGQDQLVSNEEKFRLINSHLAGIVYQFKVDANGKRSLPYVSPTIKNYIGLSADAVMDDVEQWFSLTHPDDLPGLEASIKKSMENMTVWEWEGRFIIKGDDVRWLRGSSTPSKMQDGSIVWDGVYIDVTEYKRVDNMLHTQAMIIDQIHDSVISTDLEGFIGSWNMGSEKLFGYTSEEIVGKHISILYPKEEHAFLENEVIVPLLANGAHETEVRLRRKSGKDFYAQLSLTLLYDDQGNATGMIGYAMDISGRKQSEEKLKKEKDKAQNYLDIAGVILLAINSEGEVTLINKKGCEILGYAENEIIGKNWFDNFTPERFRKDIKAVFNNLINGKGELAESFENLVLVKSGEERLVEWHNIAFSDEQGKIIGSLSSGEDITQRKQAEMALLHSEERYRSLIEATTSIIWSTDESGRFVVPQPSWAEYTGQSWDEYKDFGWAAKLHPDDVEHILTAWKKACQELSFYESYGHIWNVNLKEWRDFEVRAVPVRNPDGTLREWVGVITDVTIVKAAEAELDKYHHQLEDLVEERTQALQDAQDELVRKERLATLGQLTATVSHELRNPLGAMRPSIYMLKKYSDKNNEHINKALAVIDRNISRCDHIIDELLDFTRITELELQMTQLDEWLESVIDEQVIPEGIKLEKEFSLKGLELTIDVDRLRRAVINVIENACHAMLDDKHKKNARLTIKTRCSDERIEIIISDTGIGIAKAALNRIFEPLFSSKGFGVGLGMPTVKQIMEQHAGGIEVNSEEAKGTSVTLWLPGDVNV